MLGKLIAWGESRVEASSRLRRALAELEVVGVTTNRALLISVLGDAEFLDGAVATDFLAKRRSQLIFGEPAPVGEDYALAALWCATRHTGSDALWSDTTGWRLGAFAATRWRFGGAEASIERKSTGVYHARVGADEYALRLIARNDPAFEVEIAGRIERLAIESFGQELELFRGGRQTKLRLSLPEDELQATVTTDAGSLVTPLPGTVVAVHVSTGQRVDRGAPLLTIEAMKMEHTVTAPYAGTIERLPFAVADRVAAGAILVELKPLE